MPRILALIVPLLVALALAAPAQAATVHAEGGAGGAGHKLLWSLDFDDVADTVTITATHDQFSGAPQVNPPQQAQIVLDPPTGPTVRVNLLTAQVFNNTNGNLLALFDGDTSSMVNDGPRTRTNFRLRVSQDRAAAIAFSTLYTPPS